MGRWKKKLRSFATTLLEIPEDVVHDLPRITLIGNRQLYIENHRGVLHFSPSTLRLSLSIGELEVSGSELVIRAILPEEVLVEGFVDDIQYIKG